MIKIQLILFILITLSSCGKNKDSGVETLSPVVIGNITDEFSPLGLSSKVITKSGITYAPMDFISQELTLTFDSTKKNVKGKSVIRFKMKNNGRPYFELQSPIKNVLLDANAIDISSLIDPDGQNQTYWSINQELSPGTIHQVELAYQLPAGRVSFTNGGVGFLTDMTDLNGKFFEYWGPVGFEEDAFSLKLNLKIENSNSTHTLFTNGAASSSGSHSWNITFPEYFSKSSFFVHLTNLRGLTIKKFAYQGLDKAIPVEVYGLSATLVNSAVTQLPKLFKELEGDYGAYGHTKFLAYMNDRSGGMEYVGATITSLGSLDHELMHSWFGRSVIPADGRSGWLDEAIASWRDYGYARASSTLNRTPTNLASYSPFRKSTPSNSYVDGRALMAELDREFATLGGLRPIMKAFFKKYKNQVMTNEEFWEYLATQTKVDVGPFNFRYAQSENEIIEEPDLPSGGESKHPTTLTEEEILRLR